MPPKLTDYLSAGRILAPLEALDKRAAVVKLTALLAADEHEHAVILHAVLKREAMITTGIGHGVALPHCRLENGGPLRVTLGIAAEPLDWASYDDKPVELVFCLVGSQDDRTELTGALQEISRLMSDEGLRRELADRDDPVAALRDIESHYCQD